MKFNFNHTINYQSKSTGTNTVLYRNKLFYPKCKYEPRALNSTKWLEVI